MAQIIEAAPGVVLASGWLSAEAQRSLLDEIRQRLEAAPLFTPHMPRTGAPLSVRMTNFGSLGWVTDRERGYRYQPDHPETGLPWPSIPEVVLEAWRAIGEYHEPPEACLVNWYDAGARMGLHQDRDERDLEAPVVSLSLGDEAIFRFGGETRKEPTRSFRLKSGDAMALKGPGRLVFHGVDRIIPGSSRLLPEGGRFNLTLRRVNPPGQAS